MRGFAVHGCSLTGSPRSGWNKSGCAVRLRTFFMRMPTSSKLRCPELKRRSAVLLALTFECLAFCALAFCGLCGAPALAQSASANTAGVAAAQPLVRAPRLTLQQALLLARRYSPQFNAAVTQAGLARENLVQARAGLLPSVTYNNQYLYTEGNNTPSGRFIANNAVHEYLSQGQVHEVVPFPAGLNAMHQAAARRALAQAQRDIAARGLDRTVVADYYGVLVAEQNLRGARDNLTAAQRYWRVSQQLQRGGEVAQADVIRAQIQNNQAEQTVEDDQLALERARFSLAVLLFPNPRQAFRLVNDLAAPPPLPGFQTLARLAALHNPELRAALASLRTANAGVSLARDAFLPALSLDYWYGIDATHFATRNGPIPNLGSAAAATLNIPIWNWGATASQVRQAKLRRHQARVELAFAQRQALANLQTSYDQARAARAALARLHQTSQLAARNLHLASLRYRSGDDTILALVDAESLLAQARAAETAGQARYRVALATLNILTGGHLQPVPGAQQP